MRCHMQYTQSSKRESTTTSSISVAAWMKIFPSTCLEYLQFIGVVVLIHSRDWHQLWMLHHLVRWPDHSNHMCLGNNILSGGYKEQERLFWVSFLHAKQSKFPQLLFIILVHLIPHRLFCPLDTLPMPQHLSHGAGLEFDIPKSALELYACVCIIIKK